MLAMSLLADATQDPGFHGPNSFEISDLHCSTGNSTAGDLSGSEKPKPWNHHWKALSCERDNASRDSVAEVSESVIGPT